MFGMKERIYEKGKCKMRFKTSKKKKSNSAYEYAEISYEYLFETIKAVHVDTGDAEVWIPKSLTKDPDMDFEHETVMEIKYWFAKNEGLI